MGYLLGPDWRQAPVCRISVWYGQVCIVAISRLTRSAAWWR
ncbi:MAG TPA: hypothetical protein VNG13_00640 [Mycobacteriales bacterium]|nr:hypothetical protein [Mycobacteriales bacterium]